MRALPTVTGVQSLRSITARASSARVLDLHTLAAEAAQDEVHRLRPMFTHPVLNRTIVVKHHPRPGEFEYASDNAIVTKVIFPFDPDDLDLGGQYILVDDPDLAEQLERRLDYREGDLKRDLAVLQLFDRLPTLDPFLLHEALAAQRMEVASCYFQLSPMDRSEMREFVATQVKTLIELCFAGAAVSGAQAGRLAELILATSESAELGPLQMAFRMEGPQFAQAMFCWKAVLYYRWRSRALGPDLQATRRSIAGVAPSRFDPDTAGFVRGAIGQLETLLNDSERHIAELFRIYDGVFDALTAQHSPEPFRRFLVDGPRIFARLGGRMGRLEQLASYWAHQFPGRRTRHLSPEAVSDGLRNLLAALSLDTALIEGAPAGTERVWRFGDIETRRAG